MSNEKQKTCITITKAAIATPGTFTDFIYIPHKVDKIICKSLGFIILDAVPSLVDDAYYVTSDLITNVHDQILGVGPNLDKTFMATQNTEFTYEKKMVSGTYTFKIFSLATGNLNDATGGTSVYINLEFIELDSKQ